MTEIPTSRNRGLSRTSVDKHWLGWVFFVPRSNHREGCGDVLTGFEAILSRDSSAFDRGLLLLGLFLMGEILVAMIVISKTPPDKLAPVLRALAELFRSWRFPWGR